MRWRRKTASILRRGHRRSTAPTGTAHDPGSHIRNLAAIPPNIRRSFCAQLAQPWVILWYEVNDPHNFDVPQTRRCRMAQRMRSFHSPGRSKGMTRTAGIVA